MLQAMLHGKLTREEERMEDLLTSSTFGLMKYLPCQDVLVPFLSLASNPISGSSLRDWLMDAVCVEDWLFWPTIASPGCYPCEPDIIIKLRHQDGRVTILLIEAKYLSQKSSAASEEEGSPCDQLAREFDNLRVMAEKEGVNQYAVIYLTAGFSCPKEDLKESIKEFLQKKGSEPIIYWLSWRMLPDVLQAEHLRQNEIIQDMTELFFRFDLTMFRCLRFEEVRPPQWFFLKAPAAWYWSAKRVNWQFYKMLYWAWTMTPSLKDLKLFIFQLNYQWNVLKMSDTLYQWGKK